MLGHRLLRVIVLPLMAGITTTAYATSFSYSADLTGAAEANPNASPAIGSTQVTYDDATHSLRVQISFSGLLGTTTASHIHAPTAVPGTGTAMVATTVPTFAGFPLGVTSGTYDSGWLDLTNASSYNPAFVTTWGGTTASAEAALAAALGTGTSYLNIHTNLYPGGEIRGFLHAVPEPASWATMLLGFGLIGGVVRSRRRAKILFG
jgi:hypothetical protein